MGKGNPPGSEEAVSPTIRRGSRKVAAKILPEEEGEYYDALREKHFSENSTGSKFSAPSLEGLLNDNPKLTGSSDDRESFLELGVPEEALLPGRSYFLLQAEGEEGVVEGRDLDPDTTVWVDRVKGDTLSLSVEGERRATSVATAIVGDYPKDPSRRALITLFPGLPTDPARSSLPEDNSYGLQDGDKIPLAELQKKLGRDDLLLQIR